MQKQEIQFKHDFIPEINQKSYQSQNPSIGTIVKITKNYIYFDIGLKFLIKAKKKSFLKTFFKIEKLLKNKYNDEKYLYLNFLKGLKLGSQYKFIVYQPKLIETEFFIHFEKTYEYVKNSLLFYEFEHLKKRKKSLYGYILNSVNGGFSVAINGLVAFVPNNKIIGSKNNTYQKNKQVKHNNILNTYLEFKVLNINFERKNIILKKV